MNDHDSRPADLVMLSEAARLISEGKIRKATTLIYNNVVKKTPSPEVIRHLDSLLANRSVFDGYFPNRRVDIGGFKESDFGRSKTDHGDEKQFIERGFANAEGSRNFKLFTPSGHGGLRPLVVMLHGCAQSPEDFAIGTGMNLLGQQRGIYVAYPRQTGDANAQRCWNWFQTRDQGRGCGETSIIAGLTKGIVSEYPVDPRQVYIAGLSAGGAAAVNIARAYPDVFSAVGIHSGLAAGCAYDLSSALTAMKTGASGRDFAGKGKNFCVGDDERLMGMPTIVIHGDCDDVVNPQNAEAILAQAGVDVLSANGEIKTYPGGRSYERIVYRDGNDQIRAEWWRLAGAGHAWSGGKEAGSFTDPLGPDASCAMLDFFALHRLVDVRA